MPYSRFFIISIFTLLSVKLLAVPKPILPETVTPIFDSAKLMIYQNNYGRAFDYINQLKNINNTNNSLYIQAAINVLEGDVYSNLQVYDKAEMYYLKSCELFEKTDQIRLQHIITYQLSSIVEFSGTSPEKQNQYAIKALELAIKTKDTFDIVCCYDAIGCSYFHLKDYDKAIESSKKAEKLMGLSGPYFIANVYANIGEFYLHKGDYQNALTYIEKALKCYRNREETPEIVNSYRIAGIIYIKSGQIENGMKYLEKALNYCKTDINAPLLSRQTYDYVIEEYVRRGDFKKAFSLQREYALLKEDASKKELIVRLNQNQILLEINNRDKERQLLVNSLANEKQQNKFTLGIIILLFSLLAAIAYFYWEKKNFNQKLKKEVENQTTVLIQKNAELERFTFIASHDLKTPLRNIISFSGLLHRKLKNAEDNEVREYITFIKDYAYHMNNIIHDILDFSKIGKTEHENIEIVDLNEVKDIVLQALKEKIKQQNATVRTEGVLPIVKADKNHLIQLMQNLVENALVYNETPSPEVIIGVADDEKTGARVYIKDNGIGIQPEYQEKVFDMFTRLYSIDKYPGTGLGLAICKKIVIQYGGRIWIDSLVNKGTTVNFILPKAA